ncbi:threonine aldolase family protein [Cohnella rhizosphaerae]|uniref:Beta-eliminating lyase-related protein n=1 Tax=Cohnella rhizosphaerae TaxID=1457232 RepID=A0A9X4QV26_9BACL|nr:beta-eliminating lyase-related protein [Cohnella rhizosphaerae]MDG0812861.1 beta-eliminating lyase-related protein [Cohnella rhizosphaerae]
MKDSMTLADAFQNCKYPVVGHGKRNVRVLLESLEGTDGDTASDMYGKGDTIERFEAKMAAYLGKPEAVFFPSGTMAQQIALRIHCDETGKRKVAYHPLSHLELYEEDGLKALHRIETVLLADRDRLIRPEDVRDLEDDAACLLLELPQREIGGQLPPYAELEEISAYCRSRGIRLHLDGARLFEILPHYEKSAAEICALFDSAYVSFYKGLGGVAGAILAGEPALTERSKVWKRRHGGDLISLYPYVISSDYYFDKRIGKMAQYYEEAMALAEMYNGCADTIRTVPAVPASNMFHVHADVSKEALESILAGVAEETGVGLSAWVKALDDGGSGFEATIGDRYAAVPEDRLRSAFSLLGHKLKEGGYRA